jgi:hypothetical protein
MPVIPVKQSPVNKKNVQIVQKFSRLGSDHRKSLLVNILHEKLPLEIPGSLPINQCKTSDFVMK